ncbi:hypothetical protein Pla110_05660 [Polystyrenella longa]|uniref:DUF423 domain-containing protein n=1 Tax=Polystyrenella longa TaxID=2528007 RepID=A0A518CI06_9PLAN|nr:DUF423 domain-containing protein [Polystyrenella longa]QDU78862.1 hypothetical protein Pla110_05660 [Polystyrenella longa]
MNKNGTGWIALGAILAGIAVITGAFAAHGMDGFCAEKYGGEPAVVIAGWEHPLAYKRLNDFQVGARYQMYHALGLIAVGLLLGFRACKLVSAAGWCFLAGIILFSGSLYVLVLSGITWLGAITPIGGVLMIIGWGLLAAGAWTGRKSPAEVPAPQNARQDHT